MKSPTRLLPPALLCALVLGAVLVAPGRSASATDLAELQRQASAVADDVSGLEKELAGLRADSDKLEERISLASRELGLLEMQEQKAAEEVATATDRYVERAVERYKGGNTGTVSFMLSAETLSEAYTLAEVGSRIAAADTDAIAELNRARETAESTQDGIDERKQRLLRDKTAADAVTDEIEAALSSRRAKLVDLTVRIKELEERARAAAAAEAARSGISPDDALLALLAPSGPTPGIPDGFTPTGVAFEGVASWYGPGFEGNPTANGDIFDPDLFTAASKELPLGSWLYVEHEGRGVVVLVNDRGPYVEGRILDLSRAAAQVIGITGLGWIRAEVLIEN